MTSSLPVLHIGQQIGDLVIVKQLATSGSSALYLVRPAQNDRGDSQRADWLLRLRIRLFGIDSIGPKLVERHQLGVLKIARPEFEANLHDEHEYLARPGMRHPHLVQLYTQPSSTSTRRRPRDLVMAKLTDQQGKTGTYPCLVLAFEPGISLASRLMKRGRPLPPTLAVHIAHQTAQALRHLHQQGLVHHDVKPGNIILRPTDKIADVALLDLGAAESLENPHQRSIYGTKLYMPPERLLPGARQAITIWIDIYGLGRVLYEMLTGPLPNESTAELSNTGRTVPTLRERRPDLSPELAQLVQDATEPRLERRRQAVPSMEDFIRRLEATPEFRGELPQRRPRWIPATVGAVLVIALLISAALSSNAKPASLEGIRSPTPSVAVTADAATVPASTATVAASAVAPTPAPPPTPTIEPTSTRSPVRTSPGPTATRVP